MLKMTQLSRAELSHHLSMDRELVNLLKLCGHDPDSVMKSLGTHFLFCGQLPLVFLCFAGFGDKVMKMDRKPWDDRDQ